jgi:hypothetical protein
MHLLGKIVGIEIILKHNQVKTIKMQPYVALPNGLCLPLGV